ncbi:hypothetical protein ALC53_10833 [Atta colombica]|uniref:Uncharacterized protein n=1 Tax=Atta colombica TaxID=520822 RepID=A0A195B3K7_9HYME|nr:hypothetical protein ALC53_10833 [Atta colombica]
MGVAGRQEDNSLKRYLRGASMRLQEMKEASGSQLLVFQILNAQALRTLNARNETVVRAVTTYISFVFNKIKAVLKQWILSFYQSTRSEERKKESGRSYANEEKTKAEAKERTIRWWYSPSSSWKPNRR